MPSIEAVYIIYKVENKHLAEARVYGVFLSKANALDALKVLTVGYREDQLVWCGDRSVQTPSHHLYIVKHGIDDYTYQNWV